jgi:hypothetical protein
LRRIARDLHGQAGLDEQGARLARQGSARIGNLDLPMFP